MINIIINKTNITLSLNKTNNVICHHLFSDKHRENKISFFVFVLFVCVCNSLQTQSENQKRMNGSRWNYLILFLFLVINYPIIFCEHQRWTEYNIISESYISQLEKNTPKYDHFLDKQNEIMMMIIDNNIEQTFAITKTR